MSLQHRFTVFLVLLVVTLGTGRVLAAEMESILMVVSSYGEEGGKLRPGYEFDEFAKAYLVFRDNGFHVDIASPTGGAVEADEYDPEKPFNQEVLADTQIMSKLADTLATAVIAPDDYAAIFVVGGKGAMFDLPADESLQSVVASIYERQGVVAAVCHGPAALVDVRLSTGAYLLDSKRVNGFTNTEEQLFGKKWVKEYPFMLEDKLVERGAYFESSPIMLSHVAQDSRLITGQNPFSTSDVAIAVVRALGREPQPQKRYAEDATIQLVARVLQGDDAALEALQDTPENYQVELVGMYGYFYLKVASDTAAIDDALVLMATANETMQHPVLAMTIVEGYRKLGQTDIALEKARQLAGKMPDNAKVQALLASLEAG